MSVRLASRWHVKTTETIADGWKIGFCRLPGVTWMRIWAKRLEDGAAYHCHVFGDGNITFDGGVGRDGAPREVYDLLLDAVDHAEEFDPLSPAPVPPAPEGTP